MAVDREKISRVTKTLLSDIARESAVAHQFRRDPNVELARRGLNNEEIAEFRRSEVFESIVGQGC